MSFLMMSYEAMIRLYFEIFACNLQGQKSNDRVKKLVTYLDLSEGAPEY